MEALKFYTLDEIKDKHIGKTGTPKRDQYEAELQSSLMDKTAISKTTRKTIFVASDVLIRRRWV